MWSHVTKKERGRYSKDHEKGRTEVQNTEGRSLGTEQGIKSEKDSSSDIQEIREEMQKGGES